MSRSNDDISVHVIKKKNAQYHCGKRLVKLIIGEARKNNVDMNK